MHKETTKWREKEKENKNKTKRKEKKRKEKTKRKRKQKEKKRKEKKEKGIVKDWKQCVTFKQNETKPKKNVQKSGHTQIRTGVTRTKISDAAPTPCDLSYLTCFLYYLFHLNCSTNKNIVSKY